MPDQTLPISNQLEQAMNIIRSHIKLLAEAKIQTELSKKRIQDLEESNRKLETEVNVRDKAITDLRLRLPSSIDRDQIVKNSINKATHSNSDQCETPVKAAQATIESLQNLLKQREESVIKYQDLLKLARDEIKNINKQHELEINNLLDKVNLNRESNLKKLKQELNFTNGNSSILMNKTQLSRLQELEEVTVEQDNTISALKMNIKKLNSEIDCWKTRHELLKQKSSEELNKCKKEHIETIDRFNLQIEEYKSRIGEKESEINKVLNDLESQKQLTHQSPSSEIKQLIENLKKQLNEKEEQHKFLNKALNELKTSMIELTETHLISRSQDQNNEKKIRNLIDKTTAEYQEKLYSVSEEMVKLKKNLKEMTKQNEELTLELNFMRSKISIF